VARSRPRDLIDEAVMAWDGVSSQPHRFGGREYRLGRRELGHVHGDHLIDIPFPRRIRDAVVAGGQAAPHHILPESGWVSVHLRDTEDVRKGIELLRVSYDLARRQREARGVQTLERGAP
jgi:hypothetical protein